MTKYNNLPKKYKDFKTLAYKECANIYSNKECCREWTSDNKCIFYSKDKFKRCWYFEKCVLPNSPELQIEYNEKYLIK